jgi:hypothetical protein
MKGLIEHKKMILKIVSFVLFFHTTLFANTSYSEDSYIKSVYSSEYQNISTHTTLKNSSNNIEVSLNSFGSMSVIIMLILTSLLGAFFVRDEFYGALE